jgi:hypothetical protein
MAFLAYFFECNNSQPCPMLIVQECKQVNEIKAKINKLWKCKDLGPASTVVGFQIERNRSTRSILIHQKMYINQLL